MPWFYRCNAEYLDPNDLLLKNFNVNLASATQLPQSLVIARLTQDAYNLIQKYKISPPDPEATRESLDLTLTFCEEREG